MLVKAGREAVSVVSACLQAVILLRACQPGWLKSGPQVDSVQPRRLCCHRPKSKAQVRTGTHSARACLLANMPAGAFTCLRKPCAPDPVGRGGLGCFTGVCGTDTLMC